MGRDQMKSASQHSFHEAHTPPTVVRIPFETLVREMLEQIGEDPRREGLRQTPARVEASLKWLTRGYAMSVDDVIGALDHRNLNLDVPWFRDLNPTAENIAVVCWRVLEPVLRPARLTHIRLWETERNYVDYGGE